jgi:hypothetical protein
MRGICLRSTDNDQDISESLAQVVQRRFGVAPPAQDHEVVGIGDQASAETLLKAEFLPPQREPAQDG